MEGLYAKFQKRLVPIAGLFLVLLIVLIMVFSTFYLATTSLIRGTDYLSYLTGANIVRDGKGPKIYDLETQYFYQQEIIKNNKRDSLLPFKSTPVVAVLFIPFTYLPFILSYRVFVVFSLFLLAVLAVFLGRTFPDTKKNKLWFILPFVFYPTLRTILFGQVSILLTFLFLPLYIFFNSKKYFKGGFVFGLLVLKPQFLLAFPLFLILAKKKYEFVRGFLLSFIILVALSIVISGPSVLFDYPAFLSATENPAFGSNIKRMFTVNSSLHLITRLSARGYEYPLLTNFVLYSGAIFLLAKKVKRINFDRSFAVVIIFMLLFSVHVVVHDLSVLLIPLYILFGLYMKQKGSQKRYAGVMFVILFFVAYIGQIISPVLAMTMALFVSISLLLINPKFFKKKTG